MMRRGAPAAFLALAAALFLMAPAGAGAAPGPLPLWQRCDGAAGDLSCSIPRGIGVSPVSGHLYVADSLHARIVEYTAWGEFVKAWGWGVADGSAEPQVCTTVIDCRNGIEGGGAGEFSPPQGVAVDSGANVYVYEPVNHRVQKFDSEGHFLVMFGGQVNKTKVEEGKPEAEQNRCPVSPADVCQAGVEGTGNGQFGKAVAGSFIATGPSPSNLVYIGDNSRVEVFNPDGTFKENFPDPEGIIAAGGVVNALAAAPGNGLYLAFKEKSDVTRLTSAGKLSCTAKVAKPTAVAMAATASGSPTGNLYVFDETEGKAQARQFSNACADKEAPFAQGEVASSTGIAAGVACLTSGADIYLSNLQGSPESVRAYGTAPNKPLCPKPLFAPQIVAQYAASVGTVEAVLKVRINPRFYADTEYQLRYGTAACIEGEGWEGACVKQQPPSPAPLGAPAMDFPATSAGVAIGGLAPATTYRYRFVARSSGGGPVEGAERSFTTFPAPTSLPACLNDALRIDASALLPDCRAYELVSPLDKEGGQILTFPDNIGRPAGLSQSATTGDKLTYSSYNAFGGAEGVPYTSQYIASRKEGEGWASEAISPPRGTIFKIPSITPFTGLKGEFEAFSPDLCSAWLVHDKTTGPPLAAGASPYEANLYRRADCGAAAGSYASLGMANEDTRLQGVSADGGVAVFRTDGHLSQEAPTAVGASLNCRSAAPVTASYQWLREGAPIAAATSPQYTAKAEDAGKAIQCRLTASGGGGGSIGLANPAWVIAPYPAMAPPLTPQSISAPSASGPLAVGGAGGQTLGCDPNAAEWEGSSSFTFQWYRNGVALAGNGADTAEYTVQAADLAGAAYFQCEVLAENTGGKVAAASEVLASSPAPAAPVARPSMATNQPVLYESDGEGGPRAVCILPEGTEANRCSAGTANLLNRPTSATVDNALSSDGSRVFWADSTGEGKIYARIDGETTVPVSEAATSEPARFWTAAADGSKAIVESSGKLYEIDLSEPATPLATLIAEGARGVVGASEDASRLYFVSTKALTGSVQNNEGDVAEAGKPNLYLRQMGEGGSSSSFIGTLAVADIPSSNQGVTGLSPVAVEPYEHAARTSADGESLAFMSRASLTGYDNADATSGEADAEVYRYDAETGKLACASCNPSGARPVGRVVRTDEKPLPSAAQLPPIETQLYASHALAEDGSRIFFESFEPLLLSDTNGQADVYEWEEAGAGSCEEGSVAFSTFNAGCLYLISSGKSPLASVFLDASPDGRDVFFTTGASLLPYDPGSIDVYDARAGGGFPLPPAAKPPCEGEACQSPPAPPAPLTPASAAFEGEGNQKHHHKRKHHVRGHRKHHKRAHRNQGRAR